MTTSLLFAEGGLGVDPCLCERVTDHRGALGRPGGKLPCFKSLGNVVQGCVHTHVSAQKHSTASTAWQLGT